MVADRHHKKTGPVSSNLPAISTSNKTFLYFLFPVLGACVYWVRAVIPFTFSSFSIKAFSCQFVLEASVLISMNTEVRTYAKQGHSCAGLLLDLEEQTQNLLHQETKAALRKQSVMGSLRVTTMILSF